MTNERKILLEILAELGEHYPEMRFGQLVVNVAHWAKGPALNAVWDVTDEELIKAANGNLQFIKSNRE